MRAAYADPPYLGLASYYVQHHQEALIWDEPETHRRLIERMTNDFDCWAMSLHSPALKTILPMCPEECRVMAWVKPFVSFKPGVGVAYAWEPVIVYGGRRRTREQRTVRDYIDENITLRKGLIGTKPAAFCRWIISVLNLKPCDTLTDLFPGTGVMGREWDKFRGLPVETQGVLPFGDNECPTVSCTP